MVRQKHPTNLVPQQQASILAGLTNVDPQQPSSAPCRHCKQNLLLGLQVEQLHRALCSEGLTFGLRVYCYHLGLLNYFETPGFTFAFCIKPCELRNWPRLPIWSCSNHHQLCVDTVNTDLDKPPLPLRCHYKHVLLQLGLPARQYHRYNPLLP